MIRLTQSMKAFLGKFHRELIVPITFGHVEVITDEVKKEYLKWLETDEGKSYLEGGSNYKKEE